MDKRNNYILNYLNSNTRNLYANRRLKFTYFEQLVLHTITLFHLLLQHYNKDGRILLILHYYVPFSTMFVLISDIFSRKNTLPGRSIIEQVRSTLIQFLKQQKITFICNLLSVHTTITAFVYTFTCKIGCLDGCKQIEHL